MSTRIWAVIEFLNVDLEEVVSCWVVARDTGNDGALRYELPDGVTFDGLQLPAACESYRTRDEAAGQAEMMNADAMDRAAAELHRPMEGAQRDRVTPAQFIEAMGLDRPLGDEAGELEKLSALRPNAGPDDLDWRTVAEYLGALTRFTMHEVLKQREGAK